MGDVNNGGDCACVRVGAVWEISVPSAQNCWEPKTALKSKVYCFNTNLFIYLAALGLSCCARAFSSCRKRGLLFVAVRGLLIAVASLVGEHGL